MFVSKGRGEKPGVRERREFRTGVIVRHDNDTLPLSETFRGNCVSDTMAASTAG